MKCWVVGCDSQYVPLLSREDATSFHKLFRNGCANREWLLALRSLNDQILMEKDGKNALICGKHFEPHFLKKIGGKVRLSYGAVPTIFPKMFDEYMMTHCAYKDCRMSRTSSFMSIFVLPFDRRQDVWLKHAQCEDVRKRVFLCEAHFYAKDLKQVNRGKCLKQNAIPKSSPSVCSCSAFSVDDSCLKMMQRWRKDGNISHVNAGELSLSNTVNSANRNEGNINEKMCIKAESEDYLIIDLTCDETNNEHRYEKNDVDDDEERLVLQDEQQQSESQESEDSQSFIESSLTLPLIINAKSTTWTHFSWTCVNCLEAYDSVKKLIEHNKDVHRIGLRNIDWFCADCQNIYPLYNSLINHIRRTHRTKLTRVCDICDKSFNSYKDLKRHREKMHANEVVPKLFICELCGLALKTKIGELSHIKCHADKKNLQHRCKICHKKYRYASQLIGHVESHKVAQDREHVCDECGKKFSRRKELESHLTTHINIRLYECDVCNRSFKTPSLLIQHKERMEKDGEHFMCKECHTCFKTKDKLHTHLQRDHTLDRPFSCEFCEQTFQHKKEYMKMDERNKSTDEWKQKKKRANAGMQKYRKRKNITLDQLDSMAQNETATDEVENLTKQQIEEEKAKRRKEFSRERSRRYRELKRLNALKTVDQSIHDSQVAGTSHANPPIVTKNQSNTFHDCQIAGRSTNMDIMDHDSENENHNDEYRAEFSQANRSSVTYSSYARDSSAHIQFHKQFIQNVFGYACKICDRLWFKNDLKNLNDQVMEFVRTFLSNIDENPIAVCSTCRASIQAKSIPSMAVHNGFEYPAVPDNLLTYPLDLVSERLISPRIPFMQIRRLRHVHGQYGIYGQIINVPVEVDTMVNKLPRNINDDHCIYVHIKRNKIQKSSYVHCLVKKQIIKEWLQYLVNTPLYRTYNITIDDRFFDINHGEEVQSHGTSIMNIENRNDELDGNELSENIPIDESLLAQQQTVMWNDDLYLRITPGENNLPISLLFDEHAEELSFPSIYLGQFRQFREGVIVTPFMMATSELRRSDRRGVTPHHLLYMAMKIMRIRLKDSLTVAFKHVGNKSNITNEEIQSEDYIHNCIESNLAFLRSIPNSTWYWSERKKDLFAMIRQLGKPTVFFTINANEIGWLDLLQLLYKLNKRDHITKDAVSQLHFMVKSTLINEDAVTCAIYFNKLVNVIMNILQSKKCSPFRKYRVVHYFKRIELRHRGSPHAHILAWLENSPNDALNDDYDKAIELINDLISVSATEASGNIALQKHKHTFTCYTEITANKAQKCRFEAPFMPCKKTMILTPMKNTEEKFNNYRKNYAEIRIRLENEDFVDMDDFYNRNGIHSDEEYCNIIRAGINRPKVFVKREPSEKWHNPFNPFILNVVQSNTDFQFITEEYSCAAYVEDFINKTNKGTSHLQSKIIEVMNEHPEFDIIDVTKNISVNILNHSEITSQEAAWYLLREPMSKSSPIIVYIPTVWPTERQRIRKTMKELSELDDDCTDVWKENCFVKYEKRPEYLEEITLAQFVSKYTVNKEGEFVERRESKIIRYRNYDMATDFNEYKREMVTLHLPFRDEEEEILAEMKFITSYDNHEDIILQRRKEFESNIDINKTKQICRELCHEEIPIKEEEMQDVANRFP